MTINDYKPNMGMMGQLMDCSPETSDVGNRPKLQSPVYPPRVSCYAMPRLKVVSLCRITDHGLPTVFGLKRLLYVGPSEGLALAPRSYM